MVILFGNLAIFVSVTKFKWHHLIKYLNSNLAIHSITAQHGLVQVLYTPVNAYQFRLFTYKEVKAVAKILETTSKTGALWVAWLIVCDFTEK